MIRKIAATIGALLPCLLLVTAADAAPIAKFHPAPRRHHVASHRVQHRLTPKQVFAHLARKRPERRVFRHPPTWLKRGHGQVGPDNTDAVILNDSAPVSMASGRRSPVLESLGLLVAAYAHPPSHDAIAFRSSRAPPVCG